MNYENIILLKQPNTRKIWNKLSAIRFEFHKIIDKCGYEKSIVADSMMLAVGKISFLSINLKQIWITSPLPWQIVDMYNLNLHASDRLMVKLKFISENGLTSEIIFKRHLNTLHSADAMFH